MFGRDSISQRFQNRATPMDIRLGALRLYRQHLVSQYSDRCAFWSLRDISSETFSRTITIITDGADQELWFRFGSFLCIIAFVILSYRSWGLGWQENVVSFSQGQIHGAPAPATAHLLQGFETATPQDQNPRMLGFRPYITAGASRRNPAVWIRHGARAPDDLHREGHGPMSISWRGVPRHALRDRGQHRKGAIKNTVWLSYAAALVNHCKLRFPGSVLQYLFILALVFVPNRNDITFSWSLFSPSTVEFSFQ